MTVGKVQAAGMNLSGTGRICRLYTGSSSESAYSHSHVLPILKTSLVNLTYLRLE